MKLLSHKFYNLIWALLFSVLGGFSYMFLINFFEQSHGGLDSSNYFWILLSVLLVFNVLGFSLVHINNRINRQSLSLFRSRRKMVIQYVVIAVVLLGLNYFLFVFVRFILGADTIFAMRTSGLRVLVAIWLIELIVVSLALLNNSYHHVIELYRQTAELKESSMKAQYTALQNQLNPHFLFNSLNALISEIEYNPKNAVEFTRNLSDVYRYILQCQQQTLISVGSELEFLKSYIFLHQVRLGDCITLDSNLDDTLSDRKIPPLTLQLLAENVIKHNSISVNKPITIKLSYEKESDLLVVSNEIRLKQGVVKLGKGLENLSQRYKIICGKDIIVENNGSLFTVKIPLLDE